MHDERIRLQVISSIEIRHNDTFERIIDQKTITYSQSVDTESLEKMYGMCSKLTIQRPKQRQWSCCGVFTVYFEHIFHLLPEFLLLTRKK